MGAGRRPLLPLALEEAALGVEVRSVVGYTVVPILESHSDIKHVLLLVQSAAFAGSSEV